MTVTPVSDEEFGRLLSGIERSAFRLETRDAYVVGFEREEFGRFLAGSPRSPSEIGWWREWLGQTARLTREGKTVSRVRVLAEPPSDYQRWMLWADPWYARAGEQITYLPRSRAEQIGLVRGYDWWLLDDRRVIVMRFNDAGEIDRKELIEEPGSVIRFCAWRDLAVRNATTAERFAAA